MMKRPELHIEVSSEAQLRAIAKSGAVDAVWVGLAPYLALDSPGYREFFAIRYRIWELAQKILPKRMWLVHRATMVSPYSGDNWKDVHFEEGSYWRSANELYRGRVRKARLRHRRSAKCLDCEANGPARARFSVVENLGQTLRAVVRGGLRPSSNRFAMPTALHGAPVPYVLQQTVLSHMTGRFLWAPCYAFSRLRRAYPNHGVQIVMYDGEGLSETPETIARYWNRVLTNAVEPRSLYIGPNTLDRHDPSITDNRMFELLKELRA